MKILSLFSGAGFLDLGFEHSGYEIVYFNEINKDFASVYTYARKHMKQNIETCVKLTSEKCLHQFDVKLLLDSNKEQQEFSQILESTSSTGEIVGIIGGPPCPDFSVAGKNLGEQGERGSLTQIYTDIICTYQPDFFLFENVKGLVRTIKHRMFFEKILKQLSNKYTVYHKLVNALSYGVPQDRDRIIVVGLRKDLDTKKIPFNWQKYNWHGEPTEIKSLPWPSISPFSENSFTPCSVSNFQKQLTVEYFFRLNNVINHPNSQDFFKPRSGLAKMQQIPEGDVSKKSYKRLHRWRYSPTVAYGNNEVHLHPYKARRISVSEALALQSLPADFILPENLSLSAKFKTIGNGVPFLMAKSIAMCLKDWIEESIK